MAVNYTQEMGDLMKSRYSANPTRETVEELATEYLQVVDELAMRQTTQINKMTKADKAKLATYSKGFQISTSMVAKVLERQISLTGEASTKIFDENI